MALTETTKVDLLEILENGSIQIRIANIIEKDGTEISRVFHRKVKNPGDDVSNEDSKIQAIANVIWTPDVISLYKQSVNLENKS